jgi:hypothetical protein
MKMDEAKKKAQEAAARLNKTKQLVNTAYRQYLTLKKQRTEEEKALREALGEVRLLVKQLQDKEPRYRGHAEHTMPSMHSKCFGHSVRSHEGHYYNTPN